MMHYYFDNKTSLILFCVDEYKMQFVERLHTMLNSSDDGDTVLREFSSGLSVSLYHEADMHKLWYDIRTQAFFDPEFKPIVAKVENALIEAVEVLQSKSNSPQYAYAPSLYVMLDGMFLHFLQRCVNEDGVTIEEMTSAFMEFFKGQQMRNSAQADRTRDADAISPEILGPNSA